jgi:phosphoglycerate dehydrogenase-like enzyme
MSLTIWTNAKLEDGAMARLRDGLKGHRLVQARAASASVLDAGGEDPDLPGADVALGQPDPGQCLASDRLRWIELTTAGYTRYDNPEFRETVRARGTVFTSMSGVFAEPCAQHLMAMMLAGARQLLASHRDQLADKRWPIMERRAASMLLNRQAVLILSYGSIARRLVELLAPYHMKIYALRRRARSEPGVHVIAEERLSAVLPEVDHVVNILPENEATRNFVNARRLALCKRGARFYNVGRGTTVDQRALAEALRQGHLGSAYLDVTEPEPLPPEHELWTTPNCYITPHSAGGRGDQDHAIVDHFLHNLAALERGEPDAMTDRVE